ncbi:lipopolysaccharide biosynthesis protein [Ancylobacter terrae]|uniref:lipopolysaccharide biosynthesis protein n=1 Tax=Ancylobacter sp. sgz301288 TaxID=3342077 RepID=UPI003857FCF1
MSSHNGRIARNTLALYFRTLLTMAVSLYTSRVVLNALGASDFGLYALVGGVVTLMGFLNIAMAASTQRFLNFERNDEDPSRLAKVFGTSLLIHMLLAGASLIIAETIGLWFLNTHLNIDPERVAAANWIFQCVVLSFMVGTIVSPYTAAIIANERMVAFAYTSILDVSLKLLVAYVLTVVATDKLQIYAVLMLSASTLVAAVYILYARRNFAECRVGPRRDEVLFRQILSFSSWSIASNLSVILRLQGTSIILNLFFGTLVNAALGIATQVNTAIQSFSANFTQALNPQIVKNYAHGNMEQMRALVLNGCRLSFYLILLFALPMLLETEAVLQLWLKNVPDYTTNFVWLILVQSLVESFASVMATAQGATGHVKWYHITLSTIGLLNLPVSYLLLKAGFAPYVVLVVAILFSTLIGACRALFLRRSIRLSLSAFVTTVLLRCLAVTALAVLAPLAVRHFAPGSLAGAFAVCVVAGLSVLVAIALVGVSGDERRMIAGKLLSRLKPAK